MSEAIRNYLLSVVAASMLSGVVLALTPEGAVHRTLSFLCGLAILLAALGPVARLDLEGLAASLSELRLRTGAAAQGVEDGSAELTAAIIKEKTEAYIWDKAAALGIAPSRVSVTVRGEGGYPYPWAVTIAARCGEAQRRQLTAVLERELAVPAERQEWVLE